MPTHKQGTVNSATTTKGLGSSSTETTKATYPASPVGVDYALNDNGTNEADIRVNFEKLALEGVVNDGGHTFGEFSLDFTGAPNIRDVETGAGGLPGSPWTPNPVSPGPGSVNPTDMGEPPAGWGMEPNSTPGTGVGSQLQPDESSAQQATAGSNLGDYGFGKSPYQS